MEPCIITICLNRVQYAMVYVHIVMKIGNSAFLRTFPDQF